MISALLRDGAVITGLYSAIGREQDYLIKVPAFLDLGFTLTDFPIHVFEFADHYAINEVIGQASCTDTTVRCARPRGESSSRTSAPDMLLGAGMFRRRRSMDRW